MDDFHLIRKGVCHFLLVINSNLGPILHHLAAIHIHYGPVSYTHLTLPTNREV